MAYVAVIYLHADMGRITAIEVSSVIRDCITRKAPFAFYRLPGKEQVCFIAGEAEAYNKVQEQSGFVFHPFTEDNQNPALFIKAEHYSTLQLDELLQASFSAAEVCRKDGNDTQVGEGEYCEQVQKAVDTIKQGTLQKVILSRVQRAGMNKPLVKLFATLCEKYPSAFVSLLIIPGKVVWVTATPELLVSAENGNIETVSLAGTKAAKSSGAWGDKEKEEQQMVTAYVSDILKQHCTDIVTDGPHDLVAGNVMHLQTKFTAKIKGDVWKLVNDLHPTPAVCGLPKDKALNFIKDTEHHNRRYYAGFSGPCNVDGKTNLYVNLRCAEIMQDHANLYIGGGITADSVPELEWKETVMKAGTLLPVFETEKEKIV